MTPSLPSFLITIDTEGDNLWDKPTTVTTRNARYLPRFQELCERYSLKPTYLVNWEMLHDPFFVEFGRDAIGRRACEVGMHLHAWNTPPIISLTDNDNLFQPYLIDFSEIQMREKVRVMTETLESTFMVKMISHRAGRWSFDERYARILVECGYLVDCSVTPHISWACYPGDPKANGGTDFTDFPQTAYFMNLENIKLTGCSPLLEIPVTIRRRSASSFESHAQALFAMNQNIIARLARRLWPEHLWLRPNGHNRRQLITLLCQALDRGSDYVEFVLHSSELMPGGSPRFKSRRSIERLYEDLEALFDATRGCLQGASLGEYRRSFIDTYQRMLPVENLVQP